MNILIIGYGSIGKRHYRILSTFNEVKNIDIVTKQNLENKRTFKEIPEADLQMYDYIVIASSTAEHYKQLVYLEAEVEGKIILVEKPLFAKYHELKIKNNFVYVAYNRRFYPIIQKVKELIDKDECYYINIITGQYLPLWRPTRDYKDTYSAKKEGGGVLLDLSHEIDYVDYILENKIKILSCVNSKISDLDIDSDDIAIVIAKTGKGTLVNFSIDYISKKFIQRMVIHLKDSTLFVDIDEMSIEQVFKNKNKKMYDFKKYSKDYSFEEMHRSLLLKNKINICTYDEAVNTMRNITKIKELSHE